MTPLIWTLIFLAGFSFIEFLALATADLRSRRSRRARRRLQRLAMDVHAASVDEELSILREIRGEEQDPFTRLFGDLRLLEPLRLLLHRAGQPLTVGRFLLLSAALTVTGTLFGHGVLDAPRLGPLLAGAGLLPLVVVAWMKRARMRRFEEIFPQALDLLSRALRAGHAMSAGLQMVGEELGDPVGSEFALVAEEVQFGLDMPLALANLDYRIDVADMPFFVSALVIQRETGGNLAEIIDSLAKVIRDRLAIEGKISALTAQSRWSANILLAAPFVFAGTMSLFRPEYVQPLWETPAGNTLAAVAAGMAVIGWVLCRRVGIVRV